MGCGPGTEYGSNQAPTPAQPGGEYRSITDDGAWCWFADPRAVFYEGAHRRTYIGWVDSRGDVRVGGYDHDSDTILQSLEPLRARVLNSSNQPDDHSNPSLLVRPDGRLTVFYSPHGRSPGGGSDLWHRTSVNPEDIREWGTEQTIGVNADGDRGYTYPNPQWLSAEANRLYLFWRGANFKPNFASSTDDGHSWTPARTLIAGTGARPYIKFTSNGRDASHFAYTDGHPRNEETNSIYYAYYRDGSLHHANGDWIVNVADLPILPMDADRVYDGRTMGRAWIWDIALDADERPVIVYTAMPDITHHFYRYARWTGTEWLDFPIVEAGPFFPQTPPGAEEREPHYSGGITLDHTAPSTVVLSRQVGGIFEVELWHTTDGGATWRAEPVTTGSRIHNVRPIIARAHRGESPRVFWMHGVYSHYTNFATAIKMR